jgi:cytochrome c oxidase cbb3-type subunit 2
MLAGSVLVAAWVAVAAAFGGAAQQPPPPAASPAADSRALYESKCANCHGREGKGDGRSAGLLRVRPRDFTAGKYKIRSTESGSLPTDEDLVRSVTVGLHGTAMPDWAAFLSPEQVRSVVGYVKAFSPRFSTEVPRPVNVGAPIPVTPQSIEKGRAAYEKLRCASCHGVDGNGRDAIASDLKDDWGQPTVPTRLSEPWTFRGGSTTRDVYLRFRTGMNGTPMPSFKEAATDEELWHLASYITSLERKPVWQMSADEARGFYRDLAERDEHNTVGRGRYLLDTLGCAYCHSPIKDDGSIVDAFKFAGGQRMSLYPFPEFVTYNLTSDRDTGLGAWTDDQIKAVLTRGTRPDGSRMLPFPMPWPSYGSLQPADVDAIVAALRALPAVSNAIPAPRDPNIVSFFWGKFQMLIVQKDQPGPTYPGNAGTPNSGKSWQTK